MIPSLRPAAALDATRPSVNLSCPSVGNCPQGTELWVGQSRHDHIRAAEDELDDAIADLKTLSALALDAGDEPRAIEFSRRMVRAILSRTPEHQDRLAREHLAAVEASLDGGVDHFQVDGLAQRGHG